MKKKVQLLLKLLKKWFWCYVKRFWMVFIYFWICLNLSLPENLKNPIFEIPKFLQILKANISRTAGANYINLSKNIKLYHSECSFRKHQKSYSLFLAFSRYCCLKEGQYCAKCSWPLVSKGWNTSHVLTEIYFKPTFL